MNEWVRIKRWVRSDRANTAEENSNRGLWWIAAILAVAIVGGVAYFIIGHMVSQAQGGASTLTSSLSTQQGLTQLAQQAESGNITGGQSTVGSGGFKAP